MGQRFGICGHTIFTGVKCETSAVEGIVLEADKDSFTVLTEFYRD